MSAFVAFVLLPTLVSGSLLAIREMWGLRVLWMVSVATAALVGVAAFAIVRPPSETSAAALAVGGALSIFLATFIVTIGPSRLGRARALLVASVLSGLCLIPGYLVGCTVADLLPVNGCFF